MIPRVNEWIASTLHRRQLRVLFVFSIKRFAFQLVPAWNRQSPIVKICRYIKLFWLVALERNEFLEPNLFSWRRTIGAHIIPSASETWKTRFFLSALIYEIWMRLTTTLLAITNIQVKWYIPIIMMHVAFLLRALIAPIINHEKNSYVVSVRRIDWVPRTSHLAVDDDYYVLLLLVLFIITSRVSSTHYYYYIITIG